MKFSSILTVLAFASSAFTIPLATTKGNSLQARDASVASASVIEHFNTFDERARSRVPKVTKPKTPKKPKTKTTPPKIAKPPKQPSKTPKKPTQPRNKNPVNLKHDKHPSVGESGAWYDSNEKVTKVFYGDDLKVHGAHVAHHDAQYPTHAGKTYKIAGGSNRADKSGEWYKNGHEALHDLKTGPGKQSHTIDPKTGKSIDRFDEKPWASLSRENDHKVSVVRVPKKESALEGSMANYAKKVHRENPASKGIKIIDNRTKKDALDPKLILKKRDLLEDMKKKAGTIIGDAKNKTEQLMDDIENDWDSFRSKMESIIEPVLSDVDWVGDNFAGFLKQDTNPDNHQMGIFWHGMDAFDDVMAANANSSDPEDRAWVSNTTNLAYEVAAMQLYNASSHKIQTALAPMLKALDEWNNGSDDSASNSTTSDDGSDDSDDSDDDTEDDDHLSSNSTVKATAHMIPVDLSLAPTGTYGGAAASSVSSKPATSAAISTTCTEEQSKATSSSIAAYSSAPAATSAAVVTSQTTAAAAATTAAVVIGY